MPEGHVGANTPKWNISKMFIIFDPGTLYMEIGWRCKWHAYNCPDNTKLGINWESTHIGLIFR
jgi:hypothetical protein